MNPHRIEPTQFQRGIPLYAVPAPVPEPPPPPKSLDMPQWFWGVVGFLILGLLGLPYAYNKGVEQGSASSKERLGNQQQVIREQHNTIDAAKRALGCKE
jgi:hypothetical protein